MHVLLNFLLIFYYNYLSLLLYNYLIHYNYFHLFISFIHLNHLCSVIVLDFACVHCLLLQRHISSHRHVHVDINNKFKKAKQLL